MKKVLSVIFKAFFVIVIFGILVLIVSILFTHHTHDIRGDKEGVTKSSLANLRTSIIIYQSDNHKKFPSDLGLLAPKYIEEMPKTRLVRKTFKFSFGDSAVDNYHPDSSKALNSTETKFTDEGGWLYNPGEGKVYINCTHTDSRGKSINSW